MQSVHDNPIQNSRVEEAPESPAFSRPLTAQEQSRQIPMQQQRVVTQRFGGDGQGFTRSVTISYGTGMNEPQITTSQYVNEPRVNINNLNNINMNFGQAQDPL